MGFYRNLVLIGLTIVTGVAIFRATFMFKQPPPPKACADLPSHKRISLKSDPNILKRFMGALNIPTLSYKIHEYDGPQMLRIIDYIRESEYNIDLKISLNFCFLISNHRLFAPKRLSSDTQFSSRQAGNCCKL